MDKILITGGWGQMGLAVALAARAKGYGLILIGRTPLSKKPEAVREVVEGLNAKIHIFDIYNPLNRDLLTALASDCKYWINAAEPYVSGQLQLEILSQNLTYLYEVAAASGFLLPGPKRFIRIGSPPAEIPSDESFSAIQARRSSQLPGTSQSEEKTSSPYPESLPLHKLPQGHLACRTPYFRAKFNLALLAHNAFTQHNLALCTALPTGLIGPFGSRHADYEPMVRALRGDFPTHLFFPANTTNVISLKTAGTGILQVAEKGTPGQSYQLAGPNLSAAIPFRWALQAAFPSQLNPGPKLDLKVFSFTLALLWAFPMTWLIRLFSKEPPWWMLPDFYALLNKMGHRSSKKAENELGFVPDGEEEIQAAVKEAVDWYRKLGMI